MFIAELGLPHIGDFDLSSLRTGIMAGSPCPVEVMRKVIDVSEGSIKPGGERHFEAFAGRAYEGTLAERHFPCLACHYRALACTDWWIRSPIAQ